MNARADGFGNRHSYTSTLWRSTFVYPSRYFALRQLWDEQGDDPTPHVTPQAEAWAAMKAFEADQPKHTSWKEKWQHERQHLGTVLRSLSTKRSSRADSSDEESPKAGPVSTKRSHGERSRSK